MKFESIQSNNTAVINTLVDKLDATNAPDLKSELLILNKNGVNRLVLNLEKTRYCDSSGLSAILTANRLCKDTNGKMVLSGLNDSIANLIRIAQLDKVFSITKTVEEAKSILLS